jgi:hypothetical protein
MLNPQKTLGREAMLRRIRELDAEIAQHERNLREREARLPIEEQLRLKLRRFIEVKISEVTVDRELAREWVDNLTRSSFLLSCG